MQVARVKKLSDVLSDPQQFLQPGHVIAQRYRIKRALGRGGMGSVYLAEDLVLGENEVAIKVLQSTGRSDPASVNRFLREVQLTHKILHENVVRTFDFGSDGDLVFYTMEYLPGESLQKALTGTGLPVKAVIDIANQLMRGLTAVHSVGVVHRDLKPANIIVGRSGTLKITDFGIARAVSAPATMFASDVLGTVRYVAPEVLRGDTATKAVDFYALGVVLFELLVGRAPYSEDNAARLILDKIDKPAPSPRAFRRDAPNWLLEGIEALLERDPKTRMHGVNRFARILDSQNDLGAANKTGSLARSISDNKIKSSASGHLSNLYERIVRSFATVAIIMCCGLMALPISKIESVNRLEATHIDTLFNLRGPVTPHPGIVIVSMDEQSYAHLGVPLTDHWPRRLHTKLLRTLADAGARRVVFDVIFHDATSDNTDDMEFAAAMRRVPTVLGSALGFSQRATINGAFMLEELLQPSELFEAESVGTGVVGLPVNHGVTRYFPSARSEVFPHLNTLSEMAVAVDRINLRNPKDQDLINFYGPAKTIPTVPYEFVISDEQAPFPQEILRDKIVFVGLGLRASTGASQRDAFITPFDQQTFGVEVHATAASNLLQDDWIRQPSSVVRAAVVIACAAIFSSLIVYLNGPVAFLSLVIATTLVLAIQYLLFSGGFLIPVVTGSIWGIVSGSLIRLIGGQSFFRARWRS
jgi:serine/threonine protein kinase